MRSRSELVARRNETVLERIRGIKRDHPFWGYRRVWAHLRYIDGIVVNKKRVYRLMKEHQLTVKLNHRLKAKRVNGGSKPRPDRPGQWWGTDMTKVLTGSGWAYIVVVLDWYTKQIVGYYAGIQAKSCHWLEALDGAINKHFPSGVRDQGLSLMSDNGSQPTSVSFIKACSNMRIKQAFTSYNNPKGNADTERMIRTMKEELLWLQEWYSVNDLTTALEEWIEKYNETYLHSALGYKTPNQVEKAYKLSHKTLLNVA